MCSPTLAITIGSTLFSAFSQYQQASAQAKSMVATAQNNQKIADYNAKVQEQNAEYQKKAGVDALQRGADEASDARTRYKQATATARATAAGQGLLADTGTPGDLQDQNTTFGELNVLTARNNAEREAYGYNVKANDFLSEANNLRLQGQVGVNNAQYGAAVTRSNGLLNATSTLVTGGANAYDKYITSASQLPWQKPGNVRPTYMGGGFY